MAKQAKKTEKDFVQEQQQYDQTIEGLEKVTEQVKTEKKSHFNNFFSKG